ncbi:hypothetical protein KUTeg_011571 [Tegillarca granosa]|uniref:Monocarboxylate transporter n=1 Tax=Tegillarca granosa TaxID=220873 RepID=A0ABQ9EZG8_TEGGR|nr:hypothetical protein KUTeg_011571 [Tegillarca granosa]
MTIGKSCYTTRVYTIFGGIMLCISYLVNAYSPNIYVVLLGSGVLFGNQWYCLIKGFGAAFTYSPATVIVGQYFEKKRGLANGIFKLGAATGSLAFPPFIRLVFDIYGVRGGLMILAGLLLNIAPCGALLRPLTFYTTKHRKKYNSNSFRAKRKADDPDVDTSFLSEDNASNNKNIAKIENPNTYSLNGKYHHSSLPHLRNIDTERKRTFSTNSEYLPSMKLSKGDIAIYASIDTVNSVIGNAEISEQKPNLDDTAKGCLHVWKNLKFREIVKKIFDKEILNNNLYRIYVLSSVLGILGFGLITSFIPPHAKDIGIDSQKIALLVSIYGGSDIFGRFIMAFISDSRYIRRSLLLAFSMLLTGISCQLLPFFTTFLWLAIFSSINGLLAGFHFTIYPLVIIDFVGIHHLSSALGTIRDQTSSYIGTFHAMGTCLIVGAFFLLLEPLVRKYQKRKQEVDTVIQEVAV